MGLTPMMQQYLQKKEQYKDALLFFRLGDFYEMFFEDAITASRELEITLTGRDCGLEERAPMCGVPYHAVEGYISRLIEKGYKVAICEQLQDPEEAKGIVERDVVRVITPGTLVESSMLDEKENNYLVSLYFDGENIGLSSVDVSTGEFYISEIPGPKPFKRAMDELSRLIPREIIVNQVVQGEDSFVSEIKERYSTYITVYHDWAYEYHTALNKLLRHFQVYTLDGYGCAHMRSGICAAGALLEYLTETQKNSLGHINEIKAYQLESYMILDAGTRRNLELTETIRDKNKRGSLLWLLDKTNTAMGGRLIRKWVQQPLLSKEEIDERLDAVEELMGDSSIMQELKELLRKIYDMERLMGRISYGNANARDLLSLRQSLSVLPSIKKLLSQCHSKLIMTLYQKFDLLQDIHDLIEASISEEAPLAIKEGNIIKDKYNEQLDRYRDAIINGKKWIAALEQEEREKTGIKNLKVGFNKVFGYYLDVTKSYYEMVPSSYIRKQTLANSERYITPELKEMEDTILGAEEKSVILEYQLFTEIRDSIASQVHRIQDTSHIISTLDALWSLAKIGFENGYSRPLINEDGIIKIKNGRHPVVEKTLHQNLFVPNDTYLDMDQDRLAIITGPNMAGKSTYMRQVALIVLMAQIGSFVPASKATIGIVDRIFTRVGASDDLSSGQSTFMVEMSEVANILHNASSKSLIILDEIGRGTSTFDGLSIAWSVIEYICNRNTLGTKTLFATHYHELTELEGQLEGVKNYCVAVKEQGDDVIFLRKIIRGGADKSFGIQVAKLAGLPVKVIDRAKELLIKLEETNINHAQYQAGKGSNSRLAASEIKAAKGVKESQVSFFEPPTSAIEEKLRSIDVLTLTPMDAMNILYKLVEDAKRK